MKTAAVYARYSSSNQTEQSIEGQLRVCREYAERNGIVIVKTYIDRAMTGTNDNRDAFQQMLKDSDKKQWERYHQQRQTVQGERHLYHAAQREVHRYLQDTRSGV